MTRLMAAVSLAAVAGSALPTADQPQSRTVFVSFAVLTDSGFPAALDRVAQQMLTQYAITYTGPPPPPTGFRLRVTRSGVTAKALERFF